MLPLCTVLSLWRICRRTSPLMGKAPQRHHNRCPNPPLGKTARRRTGCSFALMSCRWRLSRRSMKWPQRRMRLPRSRHGSLVSHIGHDLALSLCVMRCCVFSCRVFLSPFSAIEEQLHTVLAKAAKLHWANDDLVGKTAEAILLRRDADDNAHVASQL